MKVKNMYSARGNKIANQFIISDGGKETFQSYDTIIAVNEAGKITLDSNAWDYSVTTSRYRNIFLNEDKKTTISKIGMITIRTFFIISTGGYNGHYFSLSFSRPSDITPGFIKLSLCSCFCHNCCFKRFCTIKVSRKL